MQPQSLGGPYTFKYIIYAIPNFIDLLAPLSCKFFLILLLIVFANAAK